MITTMLDIPPAPPPPRILIIEGRFYDSISDALLEGAKEKLKNHAETDVITVPGALEIPAIIAYAAQKKDFYQGFVALGCVIRGETYHFEIVANESARAINSLNVRHHLCIGNGILTVENEAQAMKRADPRQLNKGGAAASACLSLIAAKKIILGL